MSEQRLHGLHKSVPPLAYASTFLQTRENPHWELRSEDSKGKVNDNIRLLQMRYGPPQKDELVSFDEEDKSISLYTPSYEFVGEIGTGLVSFVVHYENSNNPERITENLMEVVNEEGIWSWDINLTNNLLFKGNNTYLFEVMDATGKRTTFKRKITVDYDEIKIGDTYLYLDPYLKKEKQNIVRQEEDFDGIAANFLTVGCIDGDQKVVIRRNDKYELIPACLTYSLKKKYLVYFDERREGEGIYYYNAISPQDGLVYKSFPLFQWKRGSLYQSLFFYNPGGKFVQIVKATGDSLNYETLIQHFDMRTQRNTMSLRQINGEQVEIENGYEKIILYYYKTNQTKRSITYPGLRFKYYVLRSGSWRLINQGTLYHLEDDVRIAPEKEVGSAFALEARLFEDSVVVEDPFKHINFHITSLKFPTIILEKPQPEFSCDDTTLGVYGTLGDVKEFVYTNDDINLLGENRHVTSLTLADNNGSTYEVEQSYKGYISARIEPQEKGNLVGETEFTLTGFDESGKKMCEKDIVLNILPIPEY